MKKKLSLILAFCSFIFIANSQTLSSEDAAKTKDMQETITTIVNAISENFANHKGAVIINYKGDGRWQTKYQPKSNILLMYPTSAAVIEYDDTKKCHYEANYQNLNVGTLAYNAFANLAFINKKYKTKVLESTNGNVSKILVFYDKKQIGIAIKNTLQKTVDIEIGEF